jgi:hypothetical protein
VTSIEDHSLLHSPAAAAAAPIMGLSCLLTALALGGASHVAPVKDDAPALNQKLRGLCNDEVRYVDTELDLGGKLWRMGSPLLIDHTLNCSGMIRIRHGTLLALPGLASMPTNHSFLVTVLGYWNGLGVSFEEVRAFQHLCMPVFV